VTKAFMPFSDFSAKSSADIFSELKTTEHGLSNAEVALRQKQYGFNQLTVHQVRWWQILGRQFTSPFIFLLLGATILSFL
jgi:magnesium-transporting ATPase (P-type)